MCDQRVVRIMGKRLGNRPENQTDSHAGGKQHGCPGQSAKLRSLVVRAEPHRAPWAERQEQAQQQGERPHEAVEQPRRVGDGVSNRSEAFLG